MQIKLIKLAENVKRIDVGESVADRSCLEYLSTGAGLHIECFQLAGAGRSLNGDNLGQQIFVWLPKLAKTQQF